MEAALMFESERTTFLRICNEDLDTDPGAVFCDELLSYTFVPYQKKLSKISNYILRKKALEDARI